MKGICYSGILWKDHRVIVLVLVTKEKITLALLPITEVPLLTERSISGSLVGPFCLTVVVHIDGGVPRIVERRVGHGADIDPCICHLGPLRKLYRGGGIGPASSPERIGLLRAHVREIRKKDRIPGLGHG